MALGPQLFGLQLARGNTKQIEYRVIRRDGSLRWVLDRGQLVVEPDGREVFNCILIDITEARQAQSELRLSLERHKIIMDQTTDIIFEWEINSGRVLSVWSVARTRHQR